MKQYRLKKCAVLLLAGLLVFTLEACAAESNTETKADAVSVANSQAQSSGQNESSASASPSDTEARSTSASADTAANTDSGTLTNTAAVSSDGAIDASELFSKRDLKQNADLTEASAYTVSDGKDIPISAEGVYVLSGTASNVTVTVEAGDEDKVQLVLDGLSVTNDERPVIYVKNADKVFITTAEDSENSLSVTGSFTADGSTNTDAVIFSRDDLVFNGLGTLQISSTDNGISGKDDIKITGGALHISAVDHGIEANDSIAIAGGAITVQSAKEDGLHAENEDDDKEGWIYICGGTLDIDVADDGIHAVSIIQIDGGALDITAAEGIEATWVQINGGTITIAASDDGINAGRKSNSYTVAIEIHGGSLTINMGQGDTDGIDSNGNLTITGGTISVNAQSPFDYDGTLTHTGGTILVNGSETSEITNQFGGMGPGGPGFPGNPGDQGGPGFPGGGRRP